MPDEILKALQGTVGVMEGNLKAKSIYDANLDIYSYYEKLIKICNYIIENDAVQYIDNYFEVYDRFRMVIQIPNKIDIAALTNSKMDIDSLGIKMGVKGIIDSEETDTHDIDEVNDTPQSDLKTYKLINYLNNMVQDFHFLGDQLVTSKSNWDKENLKRLSNIYIDLYSLVKQFSDSISEVNILNGANFDNTEQLSNEHNMTIKLVILRLDGFMKIVKIINKYGLENIKDEDLASLEQIYSNIDLIIKTYPGNKLNPMAK